MEIVIQSNQRDTADMLAGLLAPYRYQAHIGSTVEEAARLARREGPVDLVLCLDGTASTAELKILLREISPDIRLLSLPTFRATGPAGAGDQLEAAGVIAQGGEMMDLLEGVLSAGGRASRGPGVTVESLREALIETVLAFSLLLEQYDFVNGGNGRQVMENAVQVATELGLSQTYCDEIAFAALLQDIGIFKTRAGTRSRARTREDDGTRIRQHPMRSANFIQAMKLPWRIRHIVVAHHEWYNGLGYPDGLKGRHIPLGSRILAVVNAFFSMIANRPGRAALLKGEAMEELRLQAGRQFDPEVVEIFLTQMRAKAYHDIASPQREVAILTGDEAFGALVRVKFERSGSRASVYQSGEVAMATLQTRPPNAILLDSERLCDMSGFQLLHWLKKDEALSTTPILVIAADLGGPDAFMAHDMGADDFVQKPVHPAGLVARVNALLRRRGRLVRAQFTQIHEGEGLRGSLTDLSVPELVEMLHDGRKTATVTLFGPTARGVIAFDAGVLVHASEGEESGEEAFNRLYRWVAGDYLIEHGAATAERTIRTRMDLLIADLAASSAAQRIHDKLREPEAPTGAARRAGEVTEVAQSPHLPGTDGIDEEHSAKGWAEEFSAVTGAMPAAAEPALESPPAPVPDARTPDAPELYPEMSPELLAAKNAETQVIEVASPRGAAIGSTTRAIDVFSLPFSTEKAARDRVGSRRRAKVEPVEEPEPVGAGRRSSR